MSEDFTQSFKQKAAPNVLDRIIESVAPRLGVERRHARMKLAAADTFYGASRKRPQTKSLKVTSDDADAALDMGNHEVLRDRANHLERNDAIASGALETSCVSVIGSGLSLHSNIKQSIAGISESAAGDLQKEIEFEFGLWADSPFCDITKTSNFYTLQDLAFRRVLVDGEQFVNLPKKENPAIPYNLRVQMIDSARIATPRALTEGNLPNGKYLFQGILKDSDGAPEKYYIYDRHPFGVNQYTEPSYKEVPAYNNFGDKNILHLYFIKRVGQSRGYSWFAPVIELFHVASRGTEAELTAWVVQGLLSVFISTENQLDSNIGDGQQQKKDGIQLAPGGVHYLEKGEQPPTFLDPKHPNSTYGQFVSDIHTQIGAPLGIPYEVLVKRFQSSFSAAKGALNEAWRFFKCRRAWMSTYYCQPIYEAWLTEAVARGRIRIPGYFKDIRIRKAYSNAEWIGDAMGMLNPLQEVSAAKLRVDTGLSTLQREKIEMNGSDFSDDQPQIRTEQNFLREVGLKESTIINPAANSSVTPDDEEQQNQENNKK